MLLKLGSVPSVFIVEWFVKVTKVDRLRHSVCACSLDLCFTRGNGRNVTKQPGTVAAGHIWNRDYSVGNYRWM